MSIHPAGSGKGIAAKIYVTCITHIGRPASMVAAISVLTCGNILADGSGHSQANAAICGIDHTED